MLRVMRRIPELCLFIMPMVALVGVMTGCISHDAGDSAALGHPGASLGVLLKDAVDRARVHQGLDRIDMAEIPVKVARGHARLSSAYALPDVSPYTEKTDLFYVFDRNEFPGLIHWVAVAKDRSRAFVLGECAPPQEVTAFLAYEGKASRGYFRPSEALEFMRFWAHCLPIGYDFEANVVTCPDDIRALYLLSGYQLENAEKYCARMLRAMEKDGVRDLTPRILLVAPYPRHFEMRFYALDARLDELHETVIKFRAVSYVGKAPEIEAFSVRTIGQHPSPLERLKQKQRKGERDQEQTDE